MGSITNKSATWEFLNSLWILFSFAFFAWIGFYYIGIRVKKKMWMFFGFIYFFLLLIISLSPELKNEGAVAALYYISGIVLSFYLRKDYLIRLETIKGNNVSYIENETLQKQFKKKSSPKKRKVSEKENKNLRKQIAKEFDEKGISAKRSNPEQIEELEDAVAKKAPAIKNSIKLRESKIHSLKDNVSIDINSCSIETLSELPGVTLILAKKAVNYRKNNNGFASVEEFYKVTNLKPHFIAKISDRVVCIPSVENTPTTDDTKIGRSLDL